MTKKRILVAIGFVAFAGIVLGVLAMLPPRPGVTKANFDRIAKGMELEKVAMLLGEATGPNVHMEDATGRQVLVSASWFARDGSFVVIRFDRGRVVEFEWTDSTETTMDTIRRWLHLD